jgi:hypothetical protein
MCTVGLKDVNGHSPSNFNQINPDGMSMIIFLLQPRTAMDLEFFWLPTIFTPAKLQCTFLTLSVNIPAGLTSLIAYKESRNRISWFE